MARKFDNLKHRMQSEAKKFAGIKFTGYAIYNSLGEVESYISPQQEEKEAYNRIQSHNRDFDMSEFREMVKETRQRNKEKQQKVFGE